MTWVVKVVTVVRLVSKRVRGPNSGCHLLWPKLLLILSVLWKTLVTNEVTAGLRQTLGEIKMGFIVKFPP
jgi:hypothetical protein